MVKINEYKPYRGFLDLRDYKLTIKTFKQLWRIQETLSEMEKKKKYYKKWHPTQWEKAKDLSANYQAIIMNTPVKRRLKWKN